ncbi:uncharacterized protein LOC124307220 isoform X1 [Neodiprion virginianus]|uniref:uncharacterized protein LOC124307220 isoform X1 n=1 Tax=Neodiprion virginianus TaxID=2961670 RepID=UPI001EE6B3A2|nr:uncharacterized protein LOC124307220 isoform X1 [Neodiprion virginianus]
MEDSNGSIVFREIHKNGWLRRTETVEREAARFWVVFCIHDDVEPYFEGYNNQKQAAKHSFLWNSSLQNILHLSPTLCATEQQDFEFCVNFSDQRVLRLAAPTYQDMYDWVQTVSRKLTEMKILSPKENFYSKGPGAERRPTRDPTSPLPLPPRPPPSLEVQVHVPLTNSDSANTENQTEIARVGSIRLPANQTNQLNHEENSATINQYPVSESVPNVFTFDNIPGHNGREPSTQPRFIPGGHQDRHSENVSNIENNNSSYESLFLASSHSPITPGRLIESNNSPESAESRHYAALREYRSLAPVSRPQQSGTHRAVTREGNGRQLTLREQQVLQLKREIGHRAGVRLQLRRRDCKDNIAFVDTFGTVWIAGWKQREQPMLYNVLHIGDQVLSLAGSPVHSATSARDILKNCTTPYVEMIVRRLPQGRTMTLIRGSDRETDSHGFGLELQGNEVIGVGGMALTSGLPPAALAADPSMPAGTFVNWTLTEVNGRPLNILGQGEDARERLGGVGLDVSVVMQPTDLVSSLKKFLRSHRGYKNYLLN